MAQDVVLGTIDVTKTFRLPGQKPIEILKGVNLSVYRGEKVVIVGRSGAGKSTLLHILGGLLKPTKGTVSIPKNVGFVFQSFHLMLSVLYYHRFLQFLPQYQQFQYFPFPLP